MTQKDSEPKTGVSIRLPNRLLNKIDKIARRSKVARSEVICNLIESIFETKGEDFSINNYVPQSDFEVFKADVLERINQLNKSLQ